MNKKSATIITVKSKKREKRKRKQRISGPLWSGKKETPAFACV